MYSHEDALGHEAGLAIQRLVADYWLRVDGRDARAPSDLFTDDCEFYLGNLVLRGRDVLAAFFAKRQADMLTTGRTTRHICANYRAIGLDADRVQVFTSVLAMAGNGVLPIATSLPSIADFEDICVRQSSGCWLFKSRIAKTVFLGPEAPQFAKAVPAQSASES